MLLTLVYRRYNVSHTVIGHLYPACRWDVQKKWTEKEPSWHPDTLDVILGDSCETHIITDKHGEVLRIEGVLTIEPGYAGAES